MNVRLLKRVENIVERGDIAHYEQIHFCHTGIRVICCSGIKMRLYVGKGKHIFFASAADIMNVVCGKGGHFFACDVIRFV